MRETGLRAGGGQPNRRRHRRGLSLWLQRSQPSRARKFRGNLARCVSPRLRNFDRRNCQRLRHTRSQSVCCISQQALRLLTVPWVTEVPSSPPDRRCNLSPRRCRRHMSNPTLTATAASSVARRERWPVSRDIQFRWYRNTPIPRLCSSAIQTFPDQSPAIADTESPALRAGAPSPLYPFSPVPAILESVPSASILRI